MFLSFFFLFLSFTFLIFVFISVFLSLYRSFCLFPSSWFVCLSFDLLLWSFASLLSSRSFFHTLSFSFPFFMFPLLFSWTFFLFVLFFTFVIFVFTSVFRSLCFFLLSILSFIPFWSFLFYFFWLSSHSWSFTLSLSWAFFFSCVFALPVARFPSTALPLIFDTPHHKTRHGTSRPFHNEVLMETVYHHTAIVCLSHFFPACTPQALCLPEAAQQNLYTHFCFINKTLLCHER